MINRLPASAVFILLLFTAMSTSCFAKSSRDYILSKGNIMMVAPPVINKDYFSFEFGFLNEKKINSWNYDYSTYVSAIIFQDWVEKEPHQRAGGLGFRGGVILPFQPWIPLLSTFTIGYSKTVLHKNPFFGKSEANVSKKDMFSIETGLLYRIDNFFVKPVYQVSNVKYFTRNFIILFGVNY